LSASISEVGEQVNPKYLRSMPTLNPTLNPTLIYWARNFWLDKLKKLDGIFQMCRLNIAVTCRRRANFR
jgi:hypothetical protein